MFKIFSKTNVSKGNIFTIFFGGRNPENIPDVNDRVDIFRENGKWAGFGRVTKSYDDDPKFKFTFCDGEREGNLGRGYRDIEVEG